ncbi:hypothetical protein L7F22_001761 [Adiantum nelumboides]|nr:hypothetical protein [Adiantum nelumboides]
MKKVAEEILATKVSSFSASTYGMRIYKKEEDFVQSLWPILLKGKGTFNVAKKELLQAGNSIKSTTIWANPIDSLFVIAYIARAQANKAIVEDKWHCEDDALGPSKPPTRSSLEAQVPPAPEVTCDLTMDSNACSQNIDEAGSNPPSNGGEGASNKGKCKAGDKLLGPEWQFAKIVRSFIDWCCKLCGKEKSRGAPRIREHFLGSRNGSRYNGIGHENATKCLRELLGGVANAKQPKIPFPNGVPTEHQCSVASTQGVQNSGAPSMPTATQCVLLPKRHTS